MPHDKNIISTSPNCLPAIWKVKKFFFILWQGCAFDMKRPCSCLVRDQTSPSNTFNKPISQTEILLFPSLPIYFWQPGNLIGVKCGRTYSQSVFRLGHCYYLSVIGADLYSGGGPLSLLIARRVTHDAYQQTGAQRRRKTRNPLLAPCLRARKLKGRFFPSAAQKIPVERNTNDGFAFLSLFQDAAQVGLINSAGVPAH